MPELTAIESFEDGGALWLRLARPDRLNAISPQMVDRLDALLDYAEAVPGVCAVVITGSDRAFSAGADIEAIAEVISDPELALRDFVTHGQRLTMRIEHFGKPVIAAVNGLAFGGGCELVEACHLAVAAESATFAKPEIRLGFPPTWGGTQRLPRLIGRKRALEMILTASRIDARHAAEIGLINQVVPDDGLVEAVNRWVESIRAHSPSAVAACLTAVTRGAEMSIDQALAVEAGQFLRVAWRPETTAAIDAFLGRKADPTRCRMT